MTESSGVNSQSQPPSHTLPVRWPTVAVLGVCVFLASCEGIHTPNGPVCSNETSSLISLDRAVTFELDLGESITATQSITITNTSCMTVNLLHLTETQGDMSFSASSEYKSPWLKQGDSVVVDVTFAPTEPGEFKGQISLSVHSYSSSTDTPDGTIDSIELSGFAHGPAAVITWPETVMLATPYCTDSQTLSIQNDGDRPLIATPGDTTHPFFSWASPESITLAPGETETMNITFSPTELGEVDALLLLNTNEVPTEAFSEHRTVSLIATGQTVAEGQLTDSFVYGHGQTPSVLVLMDDHADDDANDTNDYMARVLLGLPTLIDELNSRTDYRISAVSADTGCPLSGFVFGDSDSSASGLADTLGQSLLAGTDGTYANRLVQLSHLATDGAIVADGCLEGWLQNPDPLHVLMISDRDDESLNGYETWLPKVQERVAGNLSYSLIGPLGDCATHPTQMMEVVASTGGQQFDLCSADWDTYWSDIAAHTGSLRASATEYIFSSEPVVSSVQVSLNGFPLDSIHWFIDTSHILRFQDSAEIAEGDTVSLVYTPQHVCDTD